MLIETIEDLNNVDDGTRVKLTPNDMNPLHSKPVMATFSGGYFMCDGSDPECGPDYYWRDVFQYNDTIEIDTALGGKAK